MHVASTSLFIDRYHHSRKLFKFCSFTVSTYFIYSIEFIVHWISIVSLYLSYCIQSVIHFIPLINLDHLFPYYYFHLLCLLCFFFQGRRLIMHRTLYCILSRSVFCEGFLCVFLLFFLFYQFFLLLYLFCLCGHVSHNLY
jgi:hypothetical protein